MLKSLLSHTRRADIIFYRSGRIDINAYAARKLHLSDGDVLGFAQENGETYIYVDRQAAEVMGRHRCTCRRTNRHGHNFRTYCRDITCHVLSNFPDVMKVEIPAGDVVQHEHHGTLLTLIIRNNLA